MSAGHCRTQLAQSTDASDCTSRSMERIRYFEVGLDSLHTAQIRVLQPGFGSTSSRCLSQSRFDCSTLDVRDERSDVLPDSPVELNLNQEDAEDIQDDTGDGQESKLEERRDVD